MGYENGIEMGNTVNFGQRERERERERDRVKGYDNWKVKSNIVLRTVRTCRSRRRLESPRARTVY